MLRNPVSRLLGLRKLFSTISRPHNEITLTFLGTGSQMPTKVRGTSCISLQHGSDVWLFDCGESSQKQLQISNIKPSNIKKIFLTHLHGDHCFGLAGTLCMIGQSQDDQSNEDQIIDIYGPEGTRAYVRAITQLTHSYIAAPHRIHELKPAKRDFTPEPHEKSVVEPVMVQKARCGERPGSTDIYPRLDGSYDLVDENTIDNNYLKVRAAPLRHTIPCVGYVIEDLEFKERNLKVDSLKEIVDRNSKALKDLYRVKERVYHVLKQLRENESFTFPDGTLVKAEDILHDPLQSRKIVILGDTCDSSKIASIAKNADLLIHEATLAYFPEEEAISYRQFERIARDRGHSTPNMAGMFAANIEAAQLILTHFSGRYSTADTPELKSIMKRIVKIAQDAGHPIIPPNSVIAASDFMSVKVPISKKGIKCISPSD